MKYIVVLGENYSAKPLFSSFFHKGVHDVLLEALHAKAQHLQNDHIAEGIGNYGGQAVAFSKDQTTGFQVCKVAAVVDSTLYAAVDPRAVDALIPAA